MLAMRSQHLSAGEKEAWMQAAAAVAALSSTGQGPAVLLLLVCLLHPVWNTQVPHALTADSQHLHLLVGPLPNAAKILTPGCTPATAQLKQQCTQALTARLYHVYCLLSGPLLIACHVIQN